MHYGTLYVIKESKRYIYSEFIPIFAASNRININTFAVSIRLSALLNSYSK